MDYVLHNVIPEDGINDFPGEEQVLGWCADIEQWQNVNWDPERCDELGKDSGWETTLGSHEVDVHYWTRLPTPVLINGKIIGC